MTDDTWSEKGKRSGRGKRPPKDRPDASTERSIPSRPSRRSEPEDVSEVVSDDVVVDDDGSADTGSTERSGTVVRRPSGDGARKVQQAAATAGQRDASFLSRLGFPALVATICLIGLITTFFAWNGRAAEASPSLADHWHAVYGIYDCTLPGEDKYVPAFQSSQDNSGIHSHGDGLIHIHPFEERSAGEGAVIERFLTEMQVTMTDTSMTLDTGRTISNGDDCADGTDGEWRVFYWQFDSLVINRDRSAPLDQIDEPTTIFTEGFNDINFDNDREVYVFVFADPDAAFDEIPLPPIERFQTLDVVAPDIDWNPTDAEGNRTIEGRDTGVSVTGETEDGEEITVTLPPDDEATDE